MEQHQLQVFLLTVVFILIGAWLQGCDGSGKISPTIATMTSGSITTATTTTFAKDEPTPYYNETEALLYVHYAQAAFCSKDAIQGWSCGSMCEKARAIPGRVRFISNGARYDVQGYVAEIEVGKCVVAFRGSISPANWRADFNIPLMRWPPSDSDRANAKWCPGCYAHHGFAIAYEELRPKVKNALVDLNCQRITLAGHSLGAAVTMLASFDLRAALGYPVDAVWTFGMPGVGNYDFVTAYKSIAKQQHVDPPLWRVIHYHDPVARMPPYIPRIYEVGQVGMEVYYTDEESSSYLLCPQNGPEGNQSLSCSYGIPLARCLTSFDHLTYLGQNFQHKKWPMATSECLHGDLEVIV